MKIVIASGKGGTGKTTVAVNFAHYLSTEESKKVTLLDCDVEAPNCNLFIDAEFSCLKDVEVPRPVWVQEKCTGCGKCSTVCNYNAIATVKDKVLIFDELCHSCGACMHLCPSKALSKELKTIGKIELAKNHAPFAFGHGVLNIGEVLAPMVIKHLKDHMDDDSINIIDAPPGTTCPVVKSMEGMDYCLLVTEPTPFGLNDLALAAALAAKLKLPTGIIINRSYGEDKIIEDFANDHQIPILGKIPFNKKYAESYSTGGVLIHNHPELNKVFLEISANINAHSSIPLFQEIEEPDIISDHDLFDDRDKKIGLDKKELVVISGKGGTGKTTVTSALAQLMDNKVLADSDVDASNLHILCHPKIIKSEDFIGGKIYVIDQDKCNGCGLCASLCNFGAIKSFTDNGSENCVVDEIACEGCGFCSHVCKQEAIDSKDSISGKWYISETKHGHLSHAKLGIGEENSGKLVSFVRDHASKLACQHGVGNILSDGPPGTGCPVISAITGVDLAIVVTEPTLSGIHDMKRALDLTKHFHIRSLIVINKYDLNLEMTNNINQIATEYNSKIIGKIPFDKNVNDALMDGQSIIDYGEGQAYNSMLELWDNLKKELV